MAQRKAAPQLSTLKDSTTLDASPGYVPHALAPESAGLPVGKWPSDVGVPGSFVDFGETPSVFYGRTSSDIWMKTTDSPILGFGRTIADFSESTKPPAEKPKSADPLAPVIPKEQPAPLPPKAAPSPVASPVAGTPPTSYIGTHPPPPPPPMVCVATSGETLFFPQQLHDSWLLWNRMTNLWWDANANYPPPPECPDNMADKVYSREEWYRRTEAWWCYMQTTYFQYMSIGVHPSPNNLRVLLARVWQQPVA